MSTHRFDTDRAVPSTRFLYVCLGCAVVSTMVCVAVGVIVAF